jgi:hypothetical protein
MAQDQSRQPSQSDSRGRSANVTLALGIDDVCRLTGLGRTSIYSAIAIGDLVARKYGRRTIILSSDVEAFLGKLPTTRVTGKPAKAAAND